jgi:alkylation response protein AidB-like acyl-CoA dehydrogenase
MVRTNTQSQQEIVETARSLAPTFADRAAEHDRENSFPYENYDDLRRVGYQALTVPREFGGRGAGLLETCLGQQELGAGDGATALGIGMHLGLFGRLSEDRAWPSAMWERVCRDVVQRGALVNAAATEPEMGSPSHGGMPTTTAHRVDGGWQITGRKTFTTLAPVLDYFVVLAAIGEGERGNFLVERGTPGLSVVETWDVLGMRATGSHDLVIDSVVVPEEARIVAPSDRPPGDGGSGRAWAALLLSAAYLGVARAARDFTAKYAQERVPTGLGKPIAELEGVQESLGRMEIAMRGARPLLLDTAAAWDRDPAGRARLTPDIAAAKYLATNAAIQVTDIAMRTAGGPALSRTLPLERLFRDARAGLYNPPQDPATLKLLGRWVLGEEQPLT